MSETMIERASRAHSPVLWRRIDQCRAIGEPARDLEEEALSRMRAAIAAMREPTEAMIDAGGEKLLGNSPMAETVWRAMYDAALAEQLADEPTEEAAAGGR